MDSLSQYKVDKKAGSFTSRARYTRNLSSLPFRGKYITDELALKTYRKGLSKKTIGNVVPLIAYPREVIFKDIEISFKYEIVVLIKTFATRPKLIRLSKPKLP